MKVKIVFDLDLEARKAISNYYGYKKPASHKTISAFIEAEISTILEDLAYDLEMGCTYETENRSK